jgi:MFS family permease
LQRDRIYPERTDAEFQEVVQRNYRWNFTFFTFEITGFFFGATLISGWTIVPLFISKLTSSPIPIGIAALLTQGSAYLPQIFTANFIERSPAMKPLVVRMGFFLERIPLVLLVVAAIVATQSPTLALVLFLVGYAWYGLGAGMLGPAWQDMIGRCFPVEKRGRFFGISSSLGTLTGVAGSGLGIWLLANYAFPRNFTFIFILAAAAILLSWVFVTLLREPIPSNSTFHQTGSEFLLSLSEILRNKHNFRRFVIARLLLGLGTMGAGFITLSAIQIWKVSDSMVGTYTTTLLIGQSLGTLIFGLLADRKGHILSLKLSALIAGAGYLLTWIAPTQHFYLVSFLFLGLATGGTIVSGFMVVLEFGEPERRPTYIGITSAGMGIVGIIAPSLGTGLASVSYPWLFGLSACMNLLAACALHFWVQEPRFSNPSGSQ